MKNMYCSVLCLEKNRVPNKRENIDVIRSMCLALQFSRPRWRWVSAATIASDRFSFFIVHGTRVPTTVREFASGQ